MAVKAVLVKVFGDDLHFDVEVDPQGPASNQAVVITMAVLMTLSMLGLIILLISVFISR